MTNRSGSANANVLQADGIHLRWVQSEYDSIRLESLFTQDEMAKQNTRRRWDSTVPSPFEQARDEVFQHIIACGVIGTHPDDQAEWFGETIKYIGDRYHELTPAQLSELRTLGERFAKPAKVGGDDSETAESASTADAASAA